MRATVCLGSFLLCLGCGQRTEHAALVPGCDPATMKCLTGSLGAEGSTSGQGEGGAGSSEEVGSLTGQVLVLNDDYFDRGALYSGMAEVSATGETASRVSGAYDGTSFSLDGVLKTAANWFLVSPQDKGTLPTIAPVDTRVVDKVTVALAATTDVDGIFLNLGTDRATQRAQVVLRVVDAQGRSVRGVKASVTGVVAYRAGTAWLSTTDGTDDSGMIFLGNIDAGSALSKISIGLSGSAQARVEAMVLTGAVSIVTAIVDTK